MTEAELNTIGSRLLELNPLEGRGLEVLTDASYPFWKRVAGGKMSPWAVRRNCTYEVLPGFLPGTPSVFIKDADEDALLFLGKTLRDEAISGVAAVLGVDPEEGCMVNLNAHPTGDVDVLFSHQWQVILQVSWFTYELADHSSLALNYLVTRM